MYFSNGAECRFIIGSETSPWPGLSVGWLASRLVCHNFLNRPGVSLPYSYRSTCLKKKLCLLHIRNGIFETSISNLQWTRGPLFRVAKSNQVRHQSYLTYSSFDFQATFQSFFIFIYSWYKFLCVEWEIVHTGTTKNISEILWNI